MITHANYLYFLSLNPFPLLASISFFNFIIGCFFFLKARNFFIISSFFFSFAISILWWISFGVEIKDVGSFRNKIFSGIKFSFILFIFSEVFFFFSFFWGYFHFFLSPVMEFNFSWPPLSVIMFKFFDIPLLNTLILLSSGVTVTLSHLFLILNNYKGYFVRLFLTFFLGLIFSFFQYLEYFNSFFSVNDSTFGSSFFLLTGFHGFHVLVGRGYLIYVFLWRFFNFFNSKLVSFELASWYWHFVDVVWIFLFFFVYILSN